MTKSITLNPVSRRILYNMLSMWAGVANNVRSAKHNGKLYWTCRWDDSVKTYHVALDPYGRIDTAWVDYTE